MQINVEQAKGIRDVEVGATRRQSGCVHTVPHQALRLASHS